MSQSGQLKELVQKLEASKSRYRTRQQISGGEGPGFYCQFEDEVTGKVWHEARGDSPQDALTNALATADFDKCPASVGDAIRIITSKDAEINELKTKLAAATAAASVVTPKPAPVAQAPAAPSEPADDSKKTPKVRPLST